MKELKSWKVDSALLHEAIDNIFTPCSSYFDIRREVRKKMAIDYKEEWEKFRVYYRNRAVISAQDEPTDSLGALMDNWINATIESREKLMQEYIRAGVDTEIVGGKEAYHTVKIIVRGHTRGCISISKDAFRNWLKERMKGEK